MDIRNKIFLAPLAGTADYAFRVICRRLGADIVCSEMVSAKATLYGDRKSAELAYLRRLPPAVYRYQYGLPRAQGLCQR